jgi:PilZ domain
MGSPQMLPHGRLEKRMSTLFPVHLRSGAQQVVAETAYTENVSAHGARILTRRKWSIDERLEIESTRWNFRSSARVAYCEALPNEEFAVGLQFLDSSLPLEGPGE